MRSRRLELPRPFGHSDLNAARLPVPPRPHVHGMFGGIRAAPGRRASSKALPGTQRQSFSPVTAQILKTVFTICPPPRYTGCHAASGRCCHRYCPRGFPLGCRAPGELDRRCHSNCADRLRGKDHSDQSTFRRSRTDGSTARKRRPSAAYEACRIRIEISYLARRLRSNPVRSPERPSQRC